MSVETKRRGFISLAERERLLREEVGNSKTNMRWSWSLTISVCALVIAVLTAATQELSARSEQRRILIEDLYANTGILLEIQLVINQMADSKLRVINQQNLTDKERSDAVAQAKQWQQVANNESKLINLFGARQKRLASHLGWIDSTPSLELERARLSEIHKVDQAMLETMKRLKNQQDEVEARLAQHSVN